MILQSIQCTKNGWSTTFDKSLDSSNTLILCFFDGSMDWTSALQNLLETYPKSIIVGCSSSGEIFDNQVKDSTFSVVITKFEKTQIRTAVADLAEFKSSADIGAELGRKMKGKDLAYVLLLSDGLNINGTELSTGITEALSADHKNAVISGGLSGDGPRFQKTTLLSMGHFKEKQVVSVGFYGTSLNVGTGSFGGWDSFGPQRTVTESKGNVLYKLDQQPALALYKTYLGEEAAKLPASALLFPLSISFGERKNIVRTILSVDEAAQSLTFAGDIPEGAKAQLMKANFSRLVSGASEAGSIAIKNLAPSKNPTLAIAISCVGRRLVLGERIEDETDAVKEVLPDGSHIIGFYSYGELSPSGVTSCELHNQTMTITILQERD
jgi:hypothetical protein